MRKLKILNIKDTFHARDILLVVLVFFHGVFNFIWIYLNNTPPSYDSAFHTVLSMEFYYFFADKNPQSILDFLQISRYYAPLTHVFGSLLFAFTQESAIIRFSGTIFYLVSIVLIYLYASLIFRNKTIGLLSAFFFSFCISVYHQSRFHMTDIPMIVFFLASLYCAELFIQRQNKRFIIVFFILVGMTLLTKWISVIFYLIPIVYYSAVIYQKRLYSWSFFSYTLVGIFICFSLCAPWYLSNIDTLLFFSSIYSSAELADPQNLFSLTNILFYVKEIIHFYISFAGVLLLCITLWFGRHNSFIRVLVLSVVIPLIILTFIPNKNTRYILPVMPWLAMILGWGTYSFFHDKGRHLEKYVASFIIVYLIMTYFILSFGFPFYPRYKATVYIPGIEWTDIVYWDRYPMRVVYDKANWKNEEIVEALSQSLRKADDSIIKVYFVLPEREYLSAATVNISIFDRMKSQNAKLIEVDTNFAAILNGKNRFDSNQEVQAYVDQLDYALVPEQTIGVEEAIYDYIPRKQIQQFFLQGKAKDFSRLEKFELPDGDNVILYERVIGDSSLRKNP
jgi:4-amino-4-deoxy-L-arabinose transferase-like glycosyltransferase